MTMIYVINKSTLVSDTDASDMTRACATQLKRHAAPLWGLAPIPVVFAGYAPTIMPGSWVFAILDDPDQADALGWHTEDQGDLIYGRVFARPSLDNGVSVSSVLSHEVLETFVDPRVNLWADNGHGTAYALEVGDPVEADSYKINAHGKSVEVSNFVTPAWFDPLAGSGDEFDYMGNVTRPFEMTAGGYVITMKEGQISAQYGREYPEWRKETKKADTARSARRG